MKSKETGFFAIRVTFERTESGEYPYCAEVDNRSWLIRVNDFPEQFIYTLIIDGQDVMDFDSWPPNWERPPIIDNAS